MFVDDCLALESTVLVVLALEEGWVVCRVSRVSKFVSIPPPVYVSRHTEVTTENSDQSVICMNLYSIGCHMAISRNRESDLRLPN